MQSNPYQRKKSEKAEKKRSRDLGERGSAYERIESRERPHATDLKTLATPLVAEPKKTKVSSLDKETSEKRSRITKIAAIEDPLSNQNAHLNSDLVRLPDMSSERPRQSETHKNFTSKDYKHE